MASETPSQDTRDVVPPTEAEQQPIQASPSSSSPAGPPTQAGTDTSLQDGMSRARTTRPALQ